MTRILIIIAFLLSVLPVSAQQKRHYTTKKSAAVLPASKQTKATQQKGTRSYQQTGKRSSSKRRGKVVKGKNGKITYETTEEIRGLQKQRSQIQAEINSKEKELKAKESDVRQRLNNLVQINTEIDQHQKSIDTIQRDIRHLDGNINILNAQLAELQKQLDDRKAKFIESMRYMARHRSIQDKIMFIFSAKSLTQMYRRLRFVRQYATFQRAQGKLVQEKQQQVNAKNQQLQGVRHTKNTLLNKDQRVKAELQGKQAEQQKVVESLKAEQKTLQDVLAQQRQKQAALNAQIDKLIAIEIRKARERAIAEAKARAAAEAAARKKRAEEAARKKAAAEAAARENARRIAEAKAREEKAKAEARAAAEAARKARAEERAAAAAESQRRAAAAAEAQRRAEQAAREAESARLAAERKAVVDRKRAEEERKREEREEHSAETESFSSADRALSGSFANNKGRLPMPMAGRIVSRYGQYSVEGLHNVHLSNNGINIKGSPGATVRCVFTGEVSAVFGFSGTSVVMVRHGAYISVYCNLTNVHVGKGQKVSARQSLGTVGNDGILQFQLRKETAKLNPEAWLGR